MSAPIFACVLRTGGIYDARWVRAFARGLREQVPDAEIVCLTDLEDLDVEGVRRIPLVYRWPGWWSKLEMLGDHAFEAGTRVFYADLDTLWVGDPEDLTSHETDFSMHRGFYRQWRLQSAIMSYRAGSPLVRRLWRRFVATPERHMQTFGGDGDYLHEYAQMEADVLPDIYPGQIRSLKVHAMGGAPEGSRIVCGHGDPRFTSPDAGWAHHHWMRLAR